MLKILSSNQIRELDQYTIDHEPIASIHLMERACQAFITWFTKEFEGQRKIGVICGTGNNLALVGVLHQRGICYQFLSVKNTDKGKDRTIFCNFMTWEILVNILLISK